MNRNTFEYALLAMKHGERVYRVGWNGRRMWLQLVRDTHVHSLMPKLPRSFDFNADPEGSVQLEQFRLDPFIMMKTTDGKYVPWLASQTDLLASDWVIL